jgi:hypothetical protein
MDKVWLVTGSASVWAGTLPTADQSIPFNAALSTSEREMIERALSECAGRGGGGKGAAAKLGVPPPDIGIHDQDSRNQ